MLNKIVKTLTEYKIALVIGSFLVFVVVCVLIVAKVSANAKPNIKIEVSPTLSLSPCFNNQVPPKTSIVSPANGSKYTTGDKVSLTGIAVLECNNSNLDESDLSWYLDTDTTAFAKGYAYSLEGLKAGDHKIKLVAIFGKLKSEVTVNVNVSDPKPQVLGIKNPPPPAPLPPPPPPNQAPVLTINSPKQNDSFQVDSINGILTAIDFRFSVSVVDDYDKLIPENNITWFIGDTSIGNGSSLSYSFIPALSCPKSLDISVTAKDSQGLIGSNKILVLLTYTPIASRICAGSAGG